jgi:hypothetical protein
MEDQAIARCHRMGQVRTVDVHRLLTDDSVDQRMLEILATKAALFDEYAAPAGRPVRSRPLGTIEWLITRIRVTFDLRPLLA